jgi:hypothetical protein
MLRSEVLFQHSAPRQDGKSFRRPLQGLTDLNGSIRQRGGGERDSSLHAVASDSRSKMSQPERSRFENARAIVFAFHGLRFGGT